VSYVLQLHQITPQRKMIFPLLCYCLGEKRPQAAMWTIDFLGFAFGISPYGRRLGAEGMRRAGRGGQGYRGQRGAKGGQRTRGIGGGIGVAMQRGHGGRAADAPQWPQRPRKPHPHPTRLHTTPSLADILLSCDRPLSKIISPKLNQRRRYQLCV